MSATSVTIKDIAKLLGVSKSTVSRALCEHNDVNADTRRKIVELARKLNYQPNTIALHLKQQRTNTIGVIIPETVNRFFAKAIAGIQRVATIAGYNVMICQSDESLLMEKKNLQSLLIARVDGILISVSGETEKGDHLQDLLQKNIPVVFFDRICEDLNTSQVFTDNYEIAFSGTEHLIAQGCSRIAIVAGPQNLNNSRNRLKGYADALKKHNLAVREEYVVMAHFRGSNVEAYTRSLLELPDRPDAIFAINDYSAVEMVHFIKKRGLHIPDDIAVLGFNNDHIGRFIEPALSTIDLSAYDMGTAAAEILVRQMKEPGFPVQKQLIKSELVIRDSTRKNGVGIGNQKSVL
ncbi:MAG TPA: LacI family DNA-binding transcriptional regulator [Chryseosolibacter sp.]|nr:LacI family DNA-binding transcriptional regulator [Chryseosolibacter sp.]